MSGPPTAPSIAAGAQNLLKAKKPAALGAARARAYSTQA